jgi:hypothetical protein
MFSPWRFSRQAVQVSPLSSQDPHHPFGVFREKRQPLALLAWGSVNPRGFFRGDAPGFGASPEKRQGLALLGRSGAPGEKRQRPSRIFESRALLQEKRRFSREAALLLRKLALLPDHPCPCVRHGSRKSPGMPIEHTGERSRHNQPRAISAEGGTVFGLRGARDLGRTMMEVDSADTMDGMASHSDPAVTERRSTQ